jgi:hypothetical protein
MVKIKKEQKTRDGEQMGKDNLNIIRKWEISKIYLETKIERQKWRNVRNKFFSSYHASKDKMIFFWKYC